MFEDGEDKPFGPPMAYEDIKTRVHAAETRSGHNESSVSLIAVSKMQPNERVLQVLEQGHQVFGENRVPEAAGKWPKWLETYPNTELHLLGPLQTNKARQAVELFDYVHSLDRMKLAKSLARLMEETGECPKLFIQVNTGEEPQKAGVLPEGLDKFVKDCLDLGLPVVGLMCIPPADEEPSLHFALLAKMAKRNGLTGLSMGMSGDFESAIAQGATHVRIGSAIFGDRAYSG